MTGPYDDLLRLPHPTSAKHPRMPVPNRAAQFLPFAALSGYGAAIAETARLTDARLELDEGQKAELNAKLVALRERLDSRPAAAFTYFVADGKKAGGAYVTRAGAVKKLDSLARRLTLTDGTVIPFDDLAEIAEPDD